MSTHSLMKKISLVAMITLTTSVFASYDGLTTDYKKWKNNNNFRDAGISLNTSCTFNAPNYNSILSLKKPGSDQLFKTNILYRANKKFSGGSCEDVGNPDVILDLEYAPGQSPTYCVTKDNKKVVAKVFNTSGDAIHSIEALPYLPEQQKADVCNYIKEGITDISQGKSILVHCSSGKDRTGAYVALLTYLFTEAENISGDQKQGIETAIMCDYLRSGTGIFSSRHAPSHYQQNYLEDMDLYNGNAAAFLINQCNSVGVTISTDVIKKAADNFINSK
ncbi:tyrosine-protein phosphatase [Fluoribacter dumoffii]|uniref:Protein tyrosine/serine phosphatase n=1 Tax=Fluoribacter dumoffii TaxID=463 RepID=A0A377G810_9GAMM|nr:tyrosine-protein phosphatase [Fluoribacter dumoffii]KTC89491.1 tyrosine specific protein phosphatase [Fluoribacter dumoffii NY 23]STO20600.1 Protein tyrosine/serine phosphatase [Fluoribacter dumoffii]